MSGDVTVEISCDPFAPEMNTEPWDLYRRLRDHAPVYYNPDLDLWMLSQYEHVKAAALDHERFSSAQGVTILKDPATGVIGPVPMGSGDFLEMDPPEHDSYRAVIRGSFTPRAIETIEDIVRETAHSLIDEFIEDGQADLATQFGGRLPSLTIARMLGLESSDAANLSQWLQEATDPPEPGRDLQDWAHAAMQAGGKIGTLLAQIAEARQAEPRGDMISQIVQARIDGEPLGDAVVGICYLLYAAGEDTSTGLITNSIRILGESPEHRRWLLDHPDRFADAVDELLRYEAPLLFVSRVTTQDVTVHGQTIPAGARVLLLWGSANRDERQFDSPNVLDFERSRIAHLAFGHGLHHCIGHVLAKREGRIALEVMLERIPDYEITGDVLVARKTFVRGCRSIPARFTPGSRRG